jgi:hypothetical protein
MFGRTGLMRRIDVHMERGNLHMERGNQLMAEVREEMRLNREEAKRSREAHSDLRQFIHEITLRSERVNKSVLEGLAEVKTGLTSSMTSIVGELAELRRETRAQTDAIFRVLDRLPPQNGPSAQEG